MVDHRTVGRGRVGHYLPVDDVTIIRNEFVPTIIGTIVDDDVLTGTLTDEITLIGTLTCPP